MKQVWFGTADDMRWVPAPLSGAQSAEVRWRAVDQYLNGGAFVRQSTTAHQEISLTWGVQSTESLAPVVSLLHQPGPFYYVDPIAAQSNIVPSYWASPQAWLDDGPPLVPGLTPVKIAGTSVNGYPATSVRFTTTKATTNTNLTIPVPPGYTLRLGVHGTGGTYKLNSGTAASPLTTASNTRTNLSINGPVFANLKVASAATCTITGIIAQVLPTGTSPKAGGFLPGLGATALMLKDDPSITNYSAVLPNAQRGIAANFVEVGAWQQ